MKLHRITAAVLPALLLASTAAWASTPPRGDVDAGSAVYHQTCVACHGANGKGQIPGTPDFTRSGGVLSLPDKVLETRIIHGFQSNGSPMAMPPDGGNPTLTPEDVHHVLAYLRATFQH